MPSSAAPHDPALCRRVVDDYRRYVDENPAYARANLDALGHEKRLVNFHTWSSNAAEIGTNPRLMQLLDFLFGMEACVYTSLLFKYGTQQPVHRDTPHFATWPRGYFFGVWTALQDIDPDSGPVFYHRGAHRYAVDERRFLEEARARKPDAPEAEQLLLALDLYYGEIIRRSPAEGPVEIPKLAIGDVVIWHPELPHGGSPANDPELTRWSMVFHCAPVAVQVHQHTDFFGHAGRKRRRRGMATRRFAVERSLRWAAPGSCSRAMIRWFDDLESYVRHTAELRPMRDVVDPYLAGREAVVGYCCVCDDIRTFRVPQPLAGAWVDLRESFACACGLNGRMRMVFRAFADAHAAVGSAARALLFERVTPLHSALARRFPAIQGCEYIRPGAAPGSMHSVHGIVVRHEDMMTLSCTDGSLDLVCHADVLEHVPDHRKALAECARALSPRGRMIFTCPFFELNDHIVRAATPRGRARAPPAARLPRQSGLVARQPRVRAVRMAVVRRHPLGRLARVRIGLLYDPFQGIVSNNNPYPEGFMWPVLFEARHAWANRP